VPTDIGVLSSSTPMQYAMHFAVTMKVSPGPGGYSLRVPATGDIYQH
jgi:hypothetical protein